MRDTILIAVISAFTSGGVLAFAQFLISRHDDKEGIKSTLKKLEKDGLRTQLLLMILLRPEEKKEILTLGERYFSKPPKGLDGNWYMTDMFKKWLKEEGHSNPEWFDRG
jgi:hypothetical protein